MSSSNTNLNSLLELSREVLNCSASEEVLLAMIEQYSEAFAAWLREQGGAITPDNRNELLKELAVNHGKVVELATKLKSGTLDQLRQVDAKGKAILAYIDQSPKRISKMGLKKG